jgi:hypothetical protein
MMTKSTTALPVHYNPDFSKIVFNPIKEQSQILYILFYCKYIYIFDEAWWCFRKKEIFLSCQREKNGNRGLQRLNKKKIILPQFPSWIPVGAKKFEISPLLLQIS